MKRFKQSEYQIKRGQLTELNPCVQAIYRMVGEADGKGAASAALRGDAANDRTRAIFERMDTNHDNVLSKEECAAFLPFSSIAT